MTDERGGVSPASDPLPESRDSESLISHLRSELREQAQELETLKQAITPLHAKDWTTGDIAMLARAHRSDSECVDDHITPIEQYDVHAYDAAALARQKQVGEQAQEIDKVKAALYDLAADPLVSAMATAEQMKAAWAALTSVIPDDTPEEPRPR